MLAVIIPTFNAEPCLAELLPQLAGRRVVISDGGSDDRTLDLAVGADAVLAVGTRGRGAQMARGAELAGADARVSGYLFLHADCRLPYNWYATTMRALATPNTAWYFSYAPHASGRGVGWLRFIVWLRGWAWNLPYGDQGLLIPRDMYEALGGYDRDKPLFEDVDLVDRIKRQFGRKALRKLPLALTTDISDHLREGVWKRGWRNYQLLRAYRKGESVETLLDRYSEELS